MSQQKPAGGVDRTHARSTTQKAVFYLLHLASGAVCTWLVLGGAETVGDWLGQTWTITQPARGGVVLGVTWLYILRHGVTLFYLLRRKVGWSEALGLGAFLVPVEVLFCLLALGIWRETSTTLGWLDGLAVVLVLVGSYFNTASEVQRKLWKARPENKGRLYTEGLFRYSMHPNYFGDMLSFTGWALLTGTLLALALPVIMTALFVFVHVPGLDSYLADHYGEQFEAYARQTKKLIPFVY